MWGLESQHDPHPNRFHACRFHGRPGAVEHGAHGASDAVPSPHLRPSSFFSGACELATSLEARLFSLRDEAHAPRQSTALTAVATAWGGFAALEQRLQSEKNGLTGGKFWFSTEMPRTAWSHLVAPDTFQFLMLRHPLARCESYFYFRMVRTWARFAALLRRESFGRNIRLSPRPTTRHHYFVG
jgi:hypothetical protein